MGNPMKVWRRVLLAAAAAIPACGGGGGGGTGGSLPPPPPGPPVAAVATPVGPQHSTVAIDYTLYDAESDPVTIAAAFSTDGGITFSPALPAFGNGSLSGLATSPGGTLHTFLWNSVDDGVATGGGPVNTQVRVRITPSDAAAGTAGTSGPFTVDNTIDRFIGVATATFPHSLTMVGNSETALGNLVADSFRIRYGTQLAFQNGWGIRAPLPSGHRPADLTLRRPVSGYPPGPPYDLVLADAYIILPFGNRVVTRTVAGSQLWAMLELGVWNYPGNNNGFPQVSGFRFTFSASNPGGARVLSVTLDGGSPILNNSTTYTLATNNFLNAGGDGYFMLNDGQGTVQELLAQVFADHIERLGTVTPVIDGRMTVVP